MTLPTPDPGAAPDGQPEPARGGREPEGPSHGPRRSGRSLIWLLLVVAAVVLALDVASKQLAIVHLSQGEAIRLVGDILALRLVHNPGAAFSLAAGTTWIFTVIAVVVVVVILRVSRRLGSAGWAASLGLLLGGATGNLLDRLLRPPAPGLGHVVDFIDYGGLFVGNVADIAIVLAAGLIMLLTVRGIGIDGSVQASGTHSA